MKKISMIATLFVLISLVSFSYAGTGHSHDKDGGHTNHGHSHGSVDSVSVKQKASRMLTGLVKKGVIDKSWKGIAPAKAEKKLFSKGEEWVVSFINDQLADSSKRTLYIFYSLDGHYIAANYTGK